MKRGAFDRFLRRAGLLGCSAAAAMLLAPGCGQLTKLRVVRLGNVEHDEASEVGSLRQALHDRAEQLIDVIKPIADNRLAVETMMKNFAGKDAAAAVQVADYPRHVEQAEALLVKLESLKDRTGVKDGTGTPLAGIDQLTNLADQLKAYAAQCTQWPDRAFELVVPIDATLAVDIKGRQRIEQAKASAKSAAASVNSLMEQTKLRAHRLQRQLNSSGFIEVGEFVINPADPDLNDISGANYGNPTVVFSEVIGTAVGETGVLLVQQSPASFRMLSLTADPTEVLRNSLVAVNQVLQIVATLSPLVGVPFPKMQLPQVAPGAQPTETPAPEPAPAQAFDPVLESRIRALRVTADHDAYQAVVAEVRGDVRTSPDERAKQAASILTYLRAALGPAQPARADPGP